MQTLHEWLEATQTKYTVHNIDENANTANYAIQIDLDHSKRRQLWQLTDATVTTATAAIVWVKHDPSRVVRRFTVGEALPVTIAETLSKHETQLQEIYSKLAYCNEEADNELQQIEQLETTTLPRIPGHRE